MNITLEGSSCIIQTLFLYEEDCVHPYQHCGCDILWMMALAVGSLIIGCCLGASGDYIHQELGEELKGEFLWRFGMVALFSILVTIQIGDGLLQHYTKGPGLFAWTYCSAFIIFNAIFTGLHIEGIHKKRQKMGLPLTSIIQDPLHRADQLIERLDCHNNSVTPITTSYKEDEAFPNHPEARPDYSIPLLIQQSQ